MALALLSHLMTALFVHVPMAYAGMSAGAVEPTASQPPCPEHMKMHQGSDARQTSGAARAGDETQASDGQRPAAHAFGASAAGHESGCKSGPCKCPCAHAQALAFVPMMAPALVARAPSASPYSVPLAPDCATSFFRPPI